MEALKKIQQKLKAPKNQRNSFGGYNYRSCEDILEAAKPLLDQENAMLLLSDELVQIGERYYVKATAKFIEGDNTIETTAYAREAEVKKGMDDSQITGTASSYARKYALNGLFLIDDTKDADTDEYARSGKGSAKKPHVTVEKISTKDLEEGPDKFRVNFREVREKLTEIDNVEELNKYWLSLKLTDKQAEILKPDFAERKVKIGVGV